MLSFDITDRHIRIIRGTEAGGRIKVASASSIDLEEGLIVNGHIKDIPRLATIISEELKSKKMADKEAVVSMCSNLVIFKELHIPKVKGNQILTMVTNQMQHTMGIADDYSISYSLAGEVVEDGVAALKILATACPFEVVDCFRKVFQMLSISLKSVMVSCNAISRIILGDRKNSGKMPMLAVQIDPTFISLNLYENNQLAFSRFASIDPADYENSEDYIYEAVNENIFRMLQFQKSRDANSPITNVVFYGDTTAYIRLTNSLESQDISTSLLGVPNTVGGYENFEFQTYANAIGAMFKSNKDLERVNLLETDEKAGKNEVGGSFAVAVLAAAGISAAVVAAVVLAMNIGISNTQKKIDDLDNQINSPETREQLAEVDRTQQKIDKVAVFKRGVEAASKNYDSLPMVVSEDYKKVIDVFLGDEEVYCNYILVKYGDGVYSVEAYCDDATFPSTIVENLYKLDMFDNIIYTGYKNNQTNQVINAAASAEINNNTGEESVEEIKGRSLYKFEVTANVKGKAVEEFLEKQSAKAKAEAEAAANGTTEEVIEEGGEG
ncbi:MAG: pilus assembly protein PilM [Oscillospiraceae bacterium]|nr:pilus assembly protein PilM [Oscillospiraceae bacterium]MCR5168174.1 pilus assembly protein PilM [Oscillospiraceae bacterium]